MFEFEVVGFKRYEGEFESRKYGGFYVHCITKSRRPDFTGSEARELKIKDRFGYVPHVGDIIHVCYDENGICSLEVI